MIGFGFNMQAGFVSGGILQRAMMMARGGMAMTAGISMPGMSMGMSMGIGLDTASFSPEALMGGGQSNFFHPLMGGMGGFPAGGIAMGMGMVPGMGTGCRGPGGVRNRQMMMLMMLIIMMMMKMMQQMGRQGMPQRGMLRQGMPQMGMPQMGMPQMGGIGMAVGMQGMGRPRQGGVVELRKGQTFNTPGGCQISWKGNTVSVKEPGGQQRILGGAAMGAAAGAGMGAVAFAGAFAGNGYAGAFAGAAVGVGGFAGAGMGMMAGVGGRTKPNNWKVWGDPHIKDGAGKRQDFKTNNAMFTLQDGTRVAMAAAGPKGVVKRVRIFLPGTPINRGTLGGINPRQTTVYHNRGLRKVAGGTLDQYMGIPGMNMSPFGNVMFG